MTKKKAAVAAGGEPAPVATTEGIAILGSHPKTVMMTPFDQPWLIYACSPHNYEMRELPRFDAWFECHNPIADATRAYPYLKYLETLPLVWMRDQKAMPYIKGARPYPEAELRGTGEMVNGQFRLTSMGEFSYYAFTSSIAYIMAMAIMDCQRLNIPQIGLFGIMQASQNEYAYQRPGIQYFIDQAWRRGIKVIAPDVSKLFEPMPEGW